MTRTLLVLAALLLASPGTLFPAENSDLTVRVESAGDELHVNVSMFVEATPADVWAVLVDYDNATKFITDLRESRIVERKGNVLRVMQRSVVRAGPFSMPIESVREIHLFEPERIEARQVSGTLGAAQTHTEIIPSGRGTVVRYRAQSQNSVFIPNSFVKREAEQKFTELRSEILKRVRGRS